MGPNRPRVERNKEMFTEEPVKQYECLGLRYLGIYLPSNAAGLNWKQAYLDPEYRWSTTTLPIKQQDRYTFENGASMLGRTHIKDRETGEYLNLNALDTDCQTVHNRLSISIGQLLDGSSWDWVTDRLRDLIKAFLVGVGVVNGDCDHSLLDVFRQSTFVTKTRKEFGHHIYWLSKQQRKAIGTADCRKGYEFEIKTDNSLGLCTLPGSAHKDDPTYRYTAVGVTDHLLANDILYDLFLEMFKDCIINGKPDDNIKDKTKNHSNKEKDDKNQKNNKKDRVIKNLVVLSPSIIKATAGYLSEFLTKGYRNEFYLRFSGMMFHSRISEESATQIIAELCAKTNDEESMARQITLTATYEKGFDGEEIEGAPKLAELIANKIAGQDIFSATLLLDNLKFMWRTDRKAKRQREQTQLVNKSVSEAKRTQSGYIKVRGSIVGMSTVYQMFKSMRVICDDCGYDETTVYKTPLYRPHAKEWSRCPNWSKGHKGGDTAVAEYEYTSTVDIWIQDIENSTELNRLQVKLFDANTYDISAGEIVDVIGHIYVVRNNDNLNSKPECVLFTDDLVYTKRKEIALTKQDKDEIQGWKSALDKKGVSVIDELTRLFAPEMIGFDHVKKGIFIQCVNAGIKNDKERLPIRMKINVLFIGDPGTAKGALSNAAIKLIPNCQSVNGIASSGISLIAVVNRDSSGAMSVNLGTLALAKNGIGRINEIGRLKLDQQPHLFDAMEEGVTDMVKYGFPANIECHVSVLATANPISNKWKNEDKISIEEFPVLLQIADRFDLIYIFRENTEEAFLDHYTKTRIQVAKNYRQGIYEGDLEKVQKYIAYARTFNPKIGDDVELLLRHFLKQMAKSGVDGLFRKFDSLLRVSIGIARLKLKSVVDVEDANEAMQIFQFMHP